MVEILRKQNIISTTKVKVQVRIWAYSEKSVQAFAAL